ncbi:hypothetical protein Taro_018078 [Colocasia esculenta]|uniref:Uncharacterized protein n=1 Tax=Colocasia esculenta TaxID=4460 RepID=A0A843UQH9_COLES|nr:hypothetical protein [Colocasia esculenta]
MEDHGLPAPLLVSEVQLLPIITIVSSALLQDLLACAVPFMSLPCGLHVVPSWSSGETAWGKMGKKGHLFIATELYYVKNFVGEGLTRRKHQL